MNNIMSYDEYLHGSCHQWVLDNFRPGDKIFVMTDYDYDIDDYALVHCGIIRNGKYLDVRGTMDSEQEVLDEFDYGPELETQIMDKEQFLKYCKENNLLQ